MASLVGKTSGETKVEVGSCPEGALRVKPGMNSLSNAVKEAQQNGITDIFLEDGEHDEKGELVNINYSISIIGESHEHCIVMGGLMMMRGKKEDDVSVRSFTLRESNGFGVLGHYGASMHLDNVSVENSGSWGVAGLVRCHS